MHRNAADTYSVLGSFPAGRAYIQSTDINTKLSASIQVSMTTFCVYSAAGNDLTAPIVFPAIALFTALRFPLSFLPMIIANCVKAFIGCQRIVEFLMAPEITGRDTSMCVLSIGGFGLVRVRTGHRYFCQMSTLNWP